MMSRILHGGRAQALLGASQDLDGFAGIEIFQRKLNMVYCNHAAQALVQHQSRSGR
jgi:hypothetical protein